MGVSYHEDEPGCELLAIAVLIAFMAVGMVVWIKLFG